MGRSKAHYWFVGPAILLMLLLLIAPVFVAAALSMTDYSLGNSGFNWIGLSQESNGRIVVVWWHFGGYESSFSID